MLSRFWISFKHLSINMLLELRKNVSEDAKALSPEASKRSVVESSECFAGYSRVYSPRIKNLLQMSPKERYTAEQALNDAARKETQLTSEATGNNLKRLEATRSNLKQLHLWITACEGCCARFGSRKRPQRPRMWISRRETTARKSLKERIIDKNHWKKRERERQREGERGALLWENSGQFWGLRTPSLTSCVDFCHKTSWRRSAHGQSTVQSIACDRKNTFPKIARIMLLGQDCSAASHAKESSIASNCKQFGWQANPAPRLKQNS